MKKILLFFIIPIWSFATSSLYIGTYVCNENQQITITSENLYIDNAEFIYEETMKNSDVFTYKNDVAFFLNLQTVIIH